MDEIKGIAIGTVITLVIGGVAYTVSQEDVVSNFATETGMTQEQAELYVDQILQDELASFVEIGTDHVEVGQEFLTLVEDIDCVEYEYEWESSRLSCSSGKAQLSTFARANIALGKSYIHLDSDSAEVADIAETLRLIDRLNAALKSDIAYIMLDASDLDEIKKSNSYNKAVLQTVLDAE